MGPVEGAMAVDIVKVESEKMLSGMVDAACELGAMVSGGAVDPDVMRANLAMMIASDAYEIYAATVGDRVLGLVAVHYYDSVTEPRLCARISEMVIRADMQGSGVSRDLVNAAAMAARVHGAGSLEVAADSDDDARVEFLHGLGFGDWQILFKMDLGG